jgi:hypothetical protein
VGRSGGKGGGVGYCSLAYLRSEYRRLGWKKSVLPDGYAALVVVVAKSKTLLDSET